MKEENVKFLERNKKYYEIFRDSDVLSHLDNSTRKGLYQIAKEEFDPKYITDIWCGDCVGKLLTYVYTQYEKHLEKEKEQVMFMTFPKHEPDETNNVNGNNTSKEPETNVLTGKTITDGKENAGSENKSTILEEKKKEEEDVVNTDLINSDLMADMFKAKEENQLIKSEEKDMKAEDQKKEDTILDEKEEGINTDTALSNDFEQITPITLPAEEKQTTNLEQKENEGEGKLEAEEVKKKRGRSKQ